MEVEIMDFISIVLVPILGRLSWQINRGGTAIEKLIVKFTALNEKVSNTHATLARHEADIRENRDGLREVENKLNQRSGLPL